MVFLISWQGLISGEQGGVAALPTRRSKVANITDFSVEVRNSENDPYFSRILYRVLKFSDFLRILQFLNFFSTFLTRNWGSSKLWSASIEVQACSCSGVVYNFMCVNPNFVIRMPKKFEKNQIPLYLEKNR